MGQYESISAGNASFGAAEICSEKNRERKRRKFFRVVAKHAYPRKTVPHLSEFTKTPERTCYDWLSGKSDAPGSVVLALLGKIAQDEMRAG